MRCCCAQKKPHLSFYSIDNDAGRKRIEAIRQEEVADLETSVLTAQNNRQLQKGGTEWPCLWPELLTLHSFELSSSYKNFSIYISYVTHTLRVCVLVLAFSQY